MGSNEKYAMLCAFLNWDAVSRSYKYLERMTFVRAILDSSKSNTFFLPIRFHVSFDGNLDVSKNSIRWFNSWYLHIIL